MPGIPAGVGGQRHRDVREADAGALVAVLVGPGQDATRLPEEATPEGKRDLNPLVVDEGRARLGRQDREHGDDLEPLRGRRPEGADEESEDGDFS